MSKTIIAIDAMGGDFGPEVTLAGVARAALAYPDVRFELYGEEAAIRQHLAKHKGLELVSTIIDCEMSIAMETKPSVALRQGRKISGMWKAIELVKNGRIGMCLGRQYRRVNGHVKNHSPHAPRH